MPNTKTIPPDPEGENKRRSDWAEGVIQLFIENTQTDREDALCDLLADLMHWCDRNDCEWIDQLIRAQQHYEAETEDA